MITYINDENKQAYTVLFEKASTKLGLLPIIEETRDPVTLEITKSYSKRVQTPSGWATVPCAEGEVDTNTDLLLDENHNPILPITSLNEYFQHIKDLANLAIGKGRSGSDPYFLRLPLDEPFFEINANTRGITVPGELSQIAIRGDKLAEIVFFRIDRYYDAVDLNTRHIYIEWELPDGTKGISRDFLRDTQSEKDKLIFGWAIGEELTQQVGTIKFAVRFVEWFDVAQTEGDGDSDERIESADKATTGAQMLYSFSSLPATVSVVDSLNYSLFEDDEALRIYNTMVTDENIGTIVLYLENSDADTADSTAPEQAKYPVFVRDLTSAFYTGASQIGDTNEYKINLVDGKLELRVEAISEDSGHISYVFGRIAHTADEGTGVAPTGANGLTPEIKFIPTTDGFDSEGNPTSGVEKVYYIFDQGYQTYLVATSDDIKDAPAGSIFERVAIVEVTAPGHYYAIADNAVSGKKISSTHSSKFYIPWAGKPVITNEGKIAARFIPLEQSHELVADTSFNQAAINNRGKTNVKLEKTTVTEDSAIALKPTVTVEGNETNGLTYQWYRNSNNHLMDGGEVANAAEYSRPEGLTNDRWAELEADLLAREGWQLIEGATGETYNASETGCYAVKVINDFNNDSTETCLLDAGACRVTGMPQIPFIDWEPFKVAASQGVILDHIEVALDGVDYDKIEYEWHKVTIPTSDAPELNEDLELATTADMDFPAGELTFDAQGNATIPFKPTTVGSFFLVVKNTLNGATAMYNAAEDSTIGLIEIAA